MSEIIGLQVAGFNKLEAVEMKFSPGGGLVRIVGSNRAGKTSVLDSIRWLLEGQKKISTHNIGDGESKATGTVELFQVGGRSYTIERSLDRAGKAKLKITDPDGLKVGGSVQKDFLNKLFNEAALNPWMLANLAPDSMLKAVMDFIGVSFDDINDKLKNLEADRRLVGQQVREYGEIPLVDKIEKPDAEKLRIEKGRLASIAKKEEQEILRFNEAQEMRQDEIDSANREIEAEYEKVKAEARECYEITQEIERLQEKLKARDSRITELNINLKTLKGSRGDLIIPEQKKEVEPSAETAEALAEVEEKMLAAASDMEKYTVYQKYLLDVKRKKEKEAEYSTLTRLIESCRTQKKERLQNAAPGIPGFEVTDEGLFLDGHHCSAWSGAQKLSFAIDVLTINPPPLKVLLIDEGSNFDPATLEALEKKAKEKGIQVFITLVAGEKPAVLDENSFYIEEGRVEGDGSE